MVCRTSPSTRVPPLHSSPLDVSLFLNWQLPPHHHKASTATTIAALQQKKANFQDVQCVHAFRPPFVDLACNSASCPPSDKFQARILGSGQ